MGYHRSIYGVGKHGFENGYMVIGRVSSFSVMTHNALVGYWGGWCEFLLVWQYWGL